MNFFAWFWTKIGGFSAFCPKKACLSIQLKAKNVKKESPAEKRPIFAPEKTKY